MKTPLSDSFARIAQVGILLLLTPLNLLVFTIIIRTGITLPKIIFTVCFLITSAFIVIMTFKTADLYIEDDFFKIKTIFGTRERSLADYKKIGSVLFIGYYIEFQDGQKTYVMFGPDEILRSNDKIREIKSVVDEKLKYFQK